MPPTTTSAHSGYHLAPPMEDRVQQLFHMPGALRERLRVEARRQHKSLGEVIRDALDAWLPQD